MVFPTPPFWEQEDSRIQTFAMPQELLKPWAGGDLEGWMVERRVNSPRNEGADLIRPVAD